jgi:4-hydroxybutyrate dehydrogenase
MNILHMKTNVQQFNTLGEYLSNGVLDGAILVTSTGIMNQTLSKFKIQVPIIFHDEYGKGEPTDIKINQMIEEKNKYPHNKIIAIGGGTVMDCAKLMALKNLTNSVDAFTGEVDLIKATPLICIPTTCGTGSEVTPITVAELTQLDTKKGLSHPALQPDEAILIPELLKDLPIKPFMHSAIDALIHATESYLSPKASKLTKVLSLEATVAILKGFQQMSFHGIDKRFDYLEDFLIGSCYAGIAFGNAGVGAVHALSYPLGGKYHVPHGEANFQFFTAVFKYYFDKQPNGAIIELVTAMSKILDCRKDRVFDTLELLLERLIEKPALRSYGMEEKDIILFTESVISGQQRLLDNNYVPLSKDDIKMIYSSLY